MKFDGNLLRRGFWLYIWRISGDACDYAYVGRTGDSSSPHASSPFRRVGQHLDVSRNAKGNTLGKQLRRACVTCEDCTFEMLTVGPLFPEQATFEQHQPLPRPDSSPGTCCRRLAARARVQGARRPPASRVSGPDSTAAGDPAPRREFPASEVALLHCLFCARCNAQGRACCATAWVINRPSLEALYAGANEGAGE